MYSWELGKRHERLFTCPGAVRALRPLEAVAVEPDIAVGELLDELHQSRNHRVEAVGLHLSMH